MYRRFDSTPGNTVSIQGQVHVAVRTLLEKYSTDDTGKITSISVTGNAKFLPLVYQPHQHHIRDTNHAGKSCWRDTLPCRDLVHAGIVHMSVARRQMRADLGRQQMQGACMTASLRRALPGWRSGIAVRL